MTAGRLCPHMGICFAHSKRSEYSHLEVVSVVVFKHLIDKLEAIRA